MHCSKRRNDTMNLKKVSLGRSIVEVCPQGEEKRKYTVTVRKNNSYQPIKVIEIVVFSSKNFTSEKRCDL